MDELAGGRSGFLVKAGHNQGFHTGPENGVRIEQQHIGGRQQPESLVHRAGEAQIPSVGHHAHTLHPARLRHGAVTRCVVDHNGGSGT